MKNDFFDRTNNVIFISSEDLYVVIKRNDSAPKQA